MAVTYKGEGPWISANNKPLDKGTKERQGVGDLDGRVLAWIARGMGLSPTWCHSFPWYLDV